MNTSHDEIRADHTVAVIDGNSLLHRAFHAVPDTMSAPDGQPTNACFGFISMLLKLVDEFNPNGVICVFDAGIPAFRTDILNQYKAQRPPTDPKLKSQFPLIRELIEALAIPVIQLEGWEGDDLLGTIARMSDEQGIDALLVSGDRDVLQLVTDNVSVVTTRKGLSDTIVYNPDAVYDRYGVTPEQVPDYLGLKGDTSDNIPGVPGIGEKTAAKLLQKYGSLESIDENSDKIKGKMGEKLRENMQSAYDSRVVATISRDVPIELDLASIEFPAFDEHVVRDAFSKVRFNAHLARVLNLNKTHCLSVDPDAFETATDSWGAAGTDAMFVVEPLFEGEDAQELLDRICRSETECAVYLGEDDDSLFSLGNDLFVGCREGAAHFGPEEAPDALVRLMRGCPIVTIDSKQLLQSILPPDTSKPALVKASDLDPGRIFDLSLAAYLLDSQRGSYDIGTLVDSFLAESMPLTDDDLRKGVAAAAAVLALKPPLEKALKEDGSYQCYTTIELPLVPVLAQMERTGVGIDTGMLEELESSTRADVEEIRHEIYRMAGQDFNIDSPKQLGEILFDKLKLPVQKKTKRGYSTNAAVLEKLSGLHPLPNKIIEYRELAKMRSTYIEALPRMRGEDGRLHTSFNQHVTATGRLSSSDPNLQNIPVRTDFGRRIRKAFSPEEPNMVFLSADYSQIELRLLAHLSDDQGLIEAFRSGSDFHSATASRVFGVSPEDVTPDMRARAKAVNFGIVYGQHAYGLSQSLHISFKEAQSMIDRYYEAYPDVQAYLQSLIDRVHDQGWVATMFGRKRHIPEVFSTNPNTRSFGERTAMNHPMQGSAADIIKLAMIRVMQRMDEMGFTARFCLQVHDELDFECPLDEVDALSEMVKAEMENVVSLRVPMSVSVSSGRTWADAK